MKRIEFERYPEYKESGVEWLGEIPKHWEILPSKRYHKILKKINSKKVCDNILSLTLRGVVNNDIDNPEGLVPKDYRSYQIFEKDNLVFKLIDLENEKTSRVGIVHELGIMSPAYIRMIIGKDFLPKYSYYYYYSLYLNLVYNKIGQGVRSTLNPNDLLKIFALKPKYSEQVAIAKFLDEKCNKIDKAITQKEKFIELLNERKQIIVQNTVTKGLNTEVEMKESEVGWIGEIPKHWKIKKLKFLGEIQNGISEGADYFGKGFPFVNYGDVYKNIELPKCVVGLANSTVRDRNKYSVKKGDIFFTRTSETIEEIGFSSTCFNDIENAIFSGFLIRFRPKKHILFEGYSKYYFSSKIHRAFFIKEMNLVIRASLSQSLLGNLPVILPSIEEQKEIFNSLEEKTQKIQDIISLQEKQIWKLKEYKGILIDNAVTGKIKVGDYHAKQD